MTTPHDPLGKANPHIQRDQQSQQYPPPGQYPPGGYPGMPPIIINNNASSSASAAAAVGGFGGRRRQSVFVHLLLFLCTAGFGNLAYALYISSWNRKRGF